jgi:uncharacterized membrane protein
MKKKKMNIDFYEGFWIFFVGCFMGVVLETLYCIVKNGYIESRQGLIYGPFNLVYGFGALLITLVLKRIKTRNIFNIFCISFVIGSLFEYICSVFQEYVYGTVSWSYSHKFLNINGRITLLYSLFWGILGIVWLKIIYPKYRKIIKGLPVNMLKAMTYILLVFMVFNTLISFFATYRRNERYYNIPASNSFERYLDNNYPDSFIDKIYPNATRKKTQK